MSKNYFLITIALLSLLLFNCKKDEVDLSKGFIKYFGGMEFDEASDMRQTSDGGYIIIGSTSSFGKGGTDIYAVKTDARGNQEWSRTYGGILNDQGSSVWQTSDGGYLMIGTFCYSDAGIDSNKTDIYVIRTNAGGDTIWTKKFGNPGINDEGISIRQTADGGLIFLGNTVYIAGNNWDVFILKLLIDGSPHPDWPNAKVLPGLSGSSSVNDYGVNIIEKPGGGFIYSSYTDNGTISDRSPRIVSLNFVGNPNNAPEKSTLNEPDMENAGEIAVGSGGTFVAGKTLSNNAFVLKLDPSSLAKQWYKPFGGGGSDMASSVEATDDGGCIVLGSTTSTGTGSSDIYLVKLNSAGDEEWSKTFGGTGVDVGRVVRKTSDGGYAILGTIEFGDDPSTKDNIISLVKVNNKGEIGN